MKDMHEESAITDIIRLGHLIQALSYNGAPVQDKLVSFNPLIESTIGEYLG
jgi:hypothetical protein